MFVSGEQDGPGANAPGRGVTVFLPQRRAPVAATARAHGHPALPAGPKGRRGGSRCGGHGRWVLGQRSGAGRFAHAGPTPHRCRLEAARTAARRHRYPTPLPNMAPSSTGVPCSNYHHAYPIYLLVPLYLIALPLYLAYLLDLDLNYENVPCPLTKKRKVC